MSENAERVIDGSWAMCSARTMDERLDMLRGRADFLAGKKNAGLASGRESREWAALMWAIAELSGIADEQRRERAAYAEARDKVKEEKVAKLRKRAEHFEGLYNDARIKNEALKARCQVLSDELYRLGRPLAAAE